MNYKLLLIVPIILLIISLIGLLYLLENGFERDIELKGGTQISISIQADTKTLETLLKDYDAKVRLVKGFSGYSTLIDVPIEKNATEIIPLLQKNGYVFEDYSFQSVGPALGESFFRQSQLALIVAFVFMSIVVFVVFRKFLPSSYVVLAASADIIETLVFSQFLGIKLSLASFAALLLLIGYSVDTDILLTSRVLKGEGEIKERIKGAMRTGLTMSGTTLAVLIVLFFASTSVVLTQIASVLLIGLIFDLINTWLGNSVLLRWYMERKA